MPVYRLTSELIFPHPELSDENGLLAVGADLSEERLLLAYSMGIFPWYSDDAPILWWSPDPRLVLKPGEIRISRSLKQTIKRGAYDITFDRDFASVIKNCAGAKRKDEPGTWITRDMIKAYTRLHESGYAHSVEAWHNNKLAGGLYGISLGSAFFGESMFTKERDASKVAFVTLAQQLDHWHYTLIDCQVTTGHLKRFGAREVPRKEFLRMLKKSLSSPTHKGKWNCGKSTAP